MREPQIHHLTFCTPRFAGAARDLRRSAASWGIGSRIYTPRHPAVRALAAEYPHILGQKRGAGYWLWKSAILLDAFRSVPEGDIVIYTDAAMTFVRNPRELCALATDGRQSVLFEHVADDTNPGYSRQSKWTKRDCFVLMDADRPEFWDLTQVIAGIQIHRNSPQARALISEWLEAATDARRLTDQPNTMGLSNLEGFVEHRHDQSILTILAHRRGIQRFPDPTIDLPGRPKFIDLHRKASYYFETFALYRASEGLRNALRPRRRWRQLLSLLRNGGRA